MTDIICFRGCVMTILKYILLTLISLDGQPVYSVLRGDFIDNSEDSRWLLREKRVENDWLVPILEIERTDDDNAYQEEIADWLEEFNKGYQKIRHEAAIVNWNYSTNITNKNAKKVEEQGVHRSEWIQPWRQQARKIDSHRLTDPFIRRQVAYIKKGSSHTDPILTRDIIKIHSKMQEIYNTGQVCLANGTCLSGEPQLARLMQTSRNYDELLWAWKEWRNTVGPPLRPLYDRFVTLSNAEATTLDYADMGELWRQELDPHNLEDKTEDLFEQIKPLYIHLHAYVRYHLQKIYGENKVSSRGPIPAHLLGNMWAQQWDSIYELMIPYQEHDIPDITSIMKKQKYTIKRMFKSAENFFLSVGLEPMTNKFWTNSLLEKPKDVRRMSCHGSATNFFDGNDYRIRMCTEVNEQDFYTVHHEMGHVEYFMAYRNLPVIFQDGANSAFHEAIGETIHYSVLTPKHLHRLKLLKSMPTKYEMDINFLMKQALLKIPLLPFSLIMDKWRWAVFSGKITSEKFNEGWWNLRLKYQGVMPPVDRSEEDFDPGAKYHIPDNTPYIRYYISTFLQVQFHEALCRLKFSGMSEPLHRCDIYGSKEAGAKLRDMLSLGASQPWQSTLELLTGQRQVIAGPLLWYYEPLYEWLVKENRRLGNYLGWEWNEYESDEKNLDNR